MFHAVSDSYEYDASGNLSQQSSDYDNDGMPENITIYERNADGNTIKTIYNTDGDGTVNDIFVTEYDDRGRITLNALYVYTTRGTGYLITIFKYDSSDNLIRSEITTYGDFDDYPKNLSVSYTYDANGNQTVMSGDIDGDGIVDQRQIYKYDANGNQTEDIIDANADGLPDIITTQEYDANGNLTKESIDEDGDGMPDEITTYVCTRLQIGDDEVSLPE